VHAGLPSDLGALQTIEGHLLLQLARVRDQLDAAGGGAYCRDLR